jgi:hypothetical protein
VARRSALAGAVGDHEETELKHRLAVARSVEEQLGAKLRDTESAVRQAEGKVREAAVMLLVEHGERLANELEPAHGGGLNPKRQRCCSTSWREPVISMCRSPVRTARFSGRPDRRWQVGKATNGS